MKRMIYMVQSKTALHTVVYVARADLETLKTPLIKTLYLTKSELPLPYPQYIMVTVEAKT